jgi:hypothetical protein
VPYVKIFLAGLGVAIGAAVLWIFVSFVLPIFGPMLIARLLNRGGASAASIGSGSILVAALIGFAIGIWWGIHRFGLAH